jgi:replicative DNA helicase Mcm
LVCIDELEKMDPTDRSAMHEAMEQQTVTISKANVQATLKARTSVLAAANPKFGRFDPTQGIAQQIDLPPTLINRFDMIFPVRDIPNRTNDEKVAVHILTEHQKEAKGMIIDKELFRKYVAYAKQKVKPHLTDEAVARIKQFYVNLRNKPIRDGLEMRTIPISARQLNALIRLAEASAKLRLSNTIDNKDTDIAIRLIKFYLEQAGYDEETGEIDIDKISGKIKSSERNKIFIVRDAIFKLRENFGEQIPIKELEKKLESILTQQEIDDAIEKLTKEGVIYKPVAGKYVALTYSKKEG